MKCLRQKKTVDGRNVSCRTCEACTANKTNEFIIRFMATARHSYSYFVTLTYSDEYLPFFGVYKDDVKRFVQSLKKYNCRYVLISEYGGRYCRPHYHLNLFFDEMPGNVFSLIEDNWSMGIIHCEVANDKQLNYIAKYHSTKILSNDVYRFKDYPVFFRVNNDIEHSDIDSYDNAKKRLCDRFNISIDEVEALEIVPCSLPFRLSSRGIGIELMQERSFISSVSHKQYYTVNNNNKKSSLPRYYVDKLPINEQVVRRCKMLEYALERPANAIDILAVQLQDYDKSMKIFEKRWSENYRENVLLRKMHNQKNF